MKTVRNIVAALALVAAPAAAVSLLATPAAAQDAVKATIDAAKAAGKVGERWDGYVGAVSTVDAATQAAIDAMNTRRKAVYAEGAAKTGATTEQAGIIFAEKLIAGLPAGMYYMPQGGGWKMK